jgi:uracil-DNA glycosylase
MITNWEDLNFWQSGEWQVCEERLDEMDNNNINYCPDRHSMFAGFDATAFDKTRVCIVGQDPYPNKTFATGVAFSIPKGVKDYPLSLYNIFIELKNDLHIPIPAHGCLSNWCAQGVLMYNVYPIVKKVPLDCAWVEWLELHKEVISCLDTKGIVFGLMGVKAQSLTLPYILKSKTVCVGHPSPLNKRNPFIGSRFFSRLNAEVEGDPIDWRL